MKQKQIFAALCAALCMTSALCGCTSERDGSNAEIEELSSAAETESTEPETTTSETETTAAETETETETTATTTETNSDAETTTAAAAKPAGDGNTRLLWSERGLEAIGVLGMGYGEDLKIGEEYLGWKLDAFDGITDESGENVKEMDVDFTYNGTLSVNGIVSVLPADAPDNPNMLYLRVDNQAEFPYFPADSRERGWFIIENSRDVFRMLELDDPPVTSKYEVAVSVTVTELHIHLKPDGYDTIHVTAASKR